MITTLTNWIMTILSLLTATGIFMHDSRVDQATLSAIHDSSLRPLDISFVDHATSVHVLDSHTHPDSGAATNALLKSFAYQSPTIPPRDRNERKLRFSLNHNDDRHAFDDELMPVIS